MSSSRPPLSSKSPLLRWLEPFFQIEAISGIILLVAAVVALLWANSPWGSAYTHLWELSLPVGAGEFTFTRSLHFWINDGLMAIFFLVVGLEIRRELHEGALATIKQAALPLVAALGGVIVPALIYLALNTDPTLRNGWAVPTATDIAFAVGVLALLGRRVPPALRVLLLSIAIIDDIVAVLVIAFFYSDGIAGDGLLITAVGILGVLALHKIGVRSAFAYVLPGAIVWYGLLRAGIHPALSGVLLGLMTPAISRVSTEASPAARVQSALHPWVAYGIMPLFALANAGVHFEGLALEAATTMPLVAGIVAGLVIGKPVGIVAATVLCMKLRWCELPAGIDMKRIFVVGCLAGIGFTMSIFICHLAFSAEPALATAKLAVLIASASASLIGLIVGGWILSSTTSQYKSG